MSCTSAALVCSSARLLGSSGSSGSSGSAGASGGALLREPRRGAGGEPRELRAPRHLQRLRGQRQRAARGERGEARGEMREEWTGKASRAGNSRWVTCIFSDVDGSVGRLCVSILADLLVLMLAFD